MAASRYAFFFDAASCSGCKACQAACKDKHELPVGLLWRRVYELVGGRWDREGEAWLPDVFAFNLSLACNHCEAPICAEVCPTGAMRRRDDGIVLWIRKRASAAATAPGRAPTAHRSSTTPPAG